MTAAEAWLERIDTPDDLLKALGHVTDEVRDAAERGEFAPISLVLAALAARVRVLVVRDLVSRGVH